MFVNVFFYYLLFAVIAVLSRQITVNILVFLNYDLFNFQVALFTFLNLIRLMLYKMFWKLFKFMDPFNILLGARLANNCEGLQQIIDRRG